MLDPIFQFFEKLIEKFTWPRFLFIAIILVMVVGSLMAYETYTGQFRLGRLERSADLLKDLAELAPAVQASGDECLIDTYKSICDELKYYARVHANPTFNTPGWALKAFAAAVPWAVLSLLMLLAGTQGMRSAMAGPRMSRAAMATTATSPRMSAYSASPWPDSRAN